MSATERPRLARCSAIEVPTMPAPSTIVSVCATEKLRPGNRLSYAREAAGRQARPALSRRLRQAVLHPFFAAHVGGGSGSRITRRLGGILGEIIRRSIGAGRRARGIGAGDHLGGRAVPCCSRRIGWTLSGAATIGAIHLMMVAMMPMLALLRLVELPGRRAGRTVGL